MTVAAIYFLKFVCNKITETFLSNQPSRPDISVDDVLQKPNLGIYKEIHVKGMDPARAKYSVEKTEGKEIILFMTTKTYHNSHHFSKIFKKMVRWYDESTTNPPC